MPSPAIPFYLRQWAVSVDTQAGDHYVVRSLVGAKEEPLRVTFAIDMYALLAYWTATISILNMSPATAGLISSGNPDLGSFWRFNQPLNAGDTVTVSAGYQTGASGAFSAESSVLYTGKILQAVWTRENVVDYRLTLRCVTGLLEDALNFVSFPWRGGATAYDTLNQVCSQAGIPFDNIDDAARQKMENTTYPRGQALHGRPYELIRQITKQSNLTTWVSPRGLNVRSFDPAKPPETPDYAYGPPEAPGGGYTTGGTQQGIIKKTLLGVPEQTQDGVLFRVLLDSSVKIGDIVQLAPGTTINLYPLQIGSLPAVPSRNGLYVVSGIRHVGDSRGRGDDWYTEIQGLTMDFFANFLMTSNG
jgi:hypothetical protein